MSPGGSLVMRGTVPDQGGEDAGRWMVFVGCPVGIAVVGAVILLILGAGGVVSAAAWSAGGWVAVAAYSLLLVPYSIAGGALEGVYGRRVGGLPCCTLVILGATAAFVLPVLAIRSLGMYETGGALLAAAGGGLGLQVAVAVTAWGLARRRVRAWGLRVPTGSR